DRPGARRRRLARGARAPPHLRRRRAMSRPAPPTGQLPPAAARLGDGTELDLTAAAAAASDRHLAEHPELLERYGEHTRAWCVHDLQWLLLWAVQDADGQ